MDESAAAAVTIVERRARPASPVPRAAGQVARVAPAAGTSRSAPTAETHRATARCCSISVDVDPLDHYFTVRGYEPTPASKLNTVYDDALPRFLDLFDRFGVRATFFIVARDAETPANARRIREIARRGHEIASHSHGHPQRFCDLSSTAKRREIETADKLLSDVTGQRLYGFRAPGWEIDAGTLDIIEELGYAYDSSVFASRGVPLISLANYVINRGRFKRGLGGSWKTGLAPKCPYRPGRKRIWRRGTRGILELPTTVLPLLELPFIHTLYYLFGRAYFELCYRWLAGLRRPVFYELHGIELVDYYETINDERIAVKPGLRKSLSEKLGIYEHMLTRFRQGYRFVTMKEYADGFDAAAGDR